MPKAALVALRALTAPAKVETAMTILDLMPSLICSGNGLEISGSSDDSSDSDD